MKMLIKYSIVTLLLIGLFAQNAFRLVRKNDNIDFEYDRLDILAIGNSNIYSGFSPQQLYKQYNYKSISLANANQSIDTSYDNLCEVLSVQKPKYVLWDIDNLFCGKNPKSFHAKKKEKCLKERNIKHLKERPKYLNQYGFMDSEAMIPSLISQNKAGGQISDSTMQYFDLMVKTCQENDVKLILVSIPNLSSWSFKKYVKIKELVNQYQLPYWDMNKENLAHVNWLTDSRDGGVHLNNNGAYKVTKIIGEYIRNRENIIFE